MGHKGYAGVPFMASPPPVELRWGQRGESSSGPTISSPRPPRASPPAPLTCRQLHPGADFIDSGCVAEEEEAEAEDGADDEEGGDAYEEHGGFEGAGGDGAEIEGAAFADELAGQRVADAVGEEAEVAGLRRVDAVADPVRLDEGHHHQDGEAEGEEGPEHPHGPRVPHVVRVVDPSRLLRRQQLGHGGGTATGTGTAPRAPAPLPGAPGAAPPRPGGTRRRRRRRDRPRGRRRDPPPPPPPTSPGGDPGGAGATPKPPPTPRSAPSRDGLGMRPGSPG